METRRKVGEFQESWPEYGDKMAEMARGKGSRERCEGETKGEVDDTASAEIMKALK